MRTVKHFENVDDDWGVKTKEIPTHSLSLSPKGDHGKILAIFENEVLLVLLHF